MEKEQLRKQLRETLNVNEDIGGKNMRSICSSYSMFREWFYQPKTQNEASFEISRVGKNQFDEEFGGVMKKLNQFENRILYPFFLEMRECMNSKLGKKKMKKEEQKEKTNQIIQQDAVEETKDVDEKTPDSKMKSALDKPTFKKKAGNANPDGVKGLAK